MFREDVASRPLNVGARDENSVLDKRQTSLQAEANREGKGVSALCITSVICPRGEE